VPTPTVPCVPPPCVASARLSGRCVPTSSGSVSGVLVSNPVVAAPSTPPRAAGVPPRTTRPPRAGSLPNTGAASDLVGWTLAGLGSIACGVAVLARRKRLQVGSTV
jgi:LPXTG-motif cell wall-anchored protein